MTAKPENMQDTHPPGPHEGPWPPGNHPVEIAARSGFGPLSSLGREIWHGRGVPCVSCGQLVLRGQRLCGHCGQDLSDEMMTKMKAYAGPWFVLEHVRPFPGVTLDRLVVQIRRSLLTETSIVRGPATDHQWRFAVETPGLSRHFGRCWKCHSNVTLADVHCPGCRSELLAPSPGQEANRIPLETGRELETGPGDDVNPEWLALKTALGKASLLSSSDEKTTERGVGGRGANWVPILLALTLVAVFLTVVSMRRAPADPKTKVQPPAATATGTPSS